LTGRKRQKKIMCGEQTPLMLTDQPACFFLWMKSDFSS